MGKSSNGNDDSCEIGSSGVKRRLPIDGGYPRPRVFFVRVASKGLRLDAASRLANMRVEAAGLSVSFRPLVRLAGKGDTEGEAEEVEEVKETGTLGGWDGRGVNGVGRASMGNDSRDSDYCQGTVLYLDNSN